MVQPVSKLPHFRHRPIRPRKMLLYNYNHRCPPAKMLNSREGNEKIPDALCMEYVPKNTVPTCATLYPKNNPNVANVANCAVCRAYGNDYFLALFCSEPPKGSSWNILKPLASQTSQKDNQRHIPLPPTDLSNNMEHEWTCYHRNSQSHVSPLYHVPTQ